MVFHMSNIVSFVAMVILFAAVIFVPVAMARGWDDYTPADGCSSKDLSNIKSFDRKANRKIKEHDKIIKKALSITTMAGTRKFNAKQKEIQNFFNSPEYIKMQETYQRCSVNIPSL